MSQIRTLHLVGATSASRTELWNGKEYLVVPVVALQEAVIHAVNAPNAEMVPGATLIASANRWNGHPLVVGHPTKDGVQISAHDDKVLAQHGFGFIRQATMAGNRLGMEAMVDPQRLELLGEREMLAALREGKPVEVSVGAFVTTRDSKGIFNGRAYDGEWADIAPDHLAFLPRGIGACSLEMGCGAHRAAMLVTAEEFKVLDNPEGHNQYSHGAAADAHSSAAKSHQEAMKAKASGNGNAGTLVAEARVASRKAEEISVGTRDAKASGLSGRAREAGKTGDHATAFKLHQDAAIYHRGKMKGLSMSLKPKSLKERILALFDSPEQAASEEKAELVAYTAMQEQLKSVGDQYDAATAIIEDLIADEEENPTTTPAQEDAEEEVEDARLDAVRMHCYTMIAGLQSICNACSDQQMPDAPSISDPRYMEAFRAAIGKTISAKNMKAIQSAHDASHDMHGHTVALGAECNGMKLLSTHTADHDGGQSAEEAQMKPEQKAKMLKALAACGCNAATDASTDEQIVDAVIAAAEKRAADLTAANAKITTLEAAQVPAEELTTLRALAAEKATREAAEKTELVTKLVTAAAHVPEAQRPTKEQLEAKTLDELKTLAVYARVETPRVVDFSGRGLPVQRDAQAEQTDYKAPRPYDEAFKAAQAK